MEQWLSSLSINLWYSCSLDGFNCLLFLNYRSIHVKLFWSKRLKKHPWTYQVLFSVDFWLFFYLFFLLLGKKSNVFFLPKGKMYRFFANYARRMVIDIAFFVFLCQVHRFRPNDPFGANLIMHIDDTIRLQRHLWSSKGTQFRKIS